VRFLVVLFVFDNVWVGFGWWVLVGSGGFWQTLVNSGWWVLGSPMCSGRCWPWSLLMDSGGFFWTLVGSGKLGRA
jgi:hypothetical protein